MTKDVPVQYGYIHVGRREQDVKVENKGVAMWELKNNLYCR